MTDKASVVAGVRSTLLLLCICLNLGSCDHADTERSRTARTTRLQLVGAWRLVDVQVVGPNGPAPDPFYNSGSTGLLIYDPSGWMSVQIVGHSRPRLEVPVSRPGPADSAEENRLKAEALDSYYAYFGVWRYDETTSTVTHHIESSLFPGENGVSYSQTAVVEGDSLVFTVRRAATGGETVQRKVWQRISSGTTG